MNRFELSIGIIKIPIDFCLTLGSLILAYYVRQYTDLIPGIQLPISLDTFPTIESYMQFAIFTALLLIIIFAIQGLYNLKITVSLYKEIFKSIMAIIYTYMAIIVYYFIIRELPFSRLVIIQSFIFTILSISTAKIIISFFQSWLLNNGIGQRTAIIIGNEDMMPELIKSIQSNNKIKYIGFIDKFKGKAKPKDKLLGKLKDFEQIILTHKPNIVIQTNTNLDQKKTSHIMNFCKYSHIEYAYLPDIVQLHQSNIETTNFGNLPIIFLRPTPLDGWGYIVKRSFDVFCSFLGLFILSISSNNQYSYKTIIKRTNIIY